jgi:hypothetical protein
VTPLTRPEVFGDFLLVARLAERGAVEVLVGVRLGDRSGRTFVLKRPRLGERASGEAARSVAREGEVLDAVRGPSLVALEAAGTLAGLPYVVTEHVDGAPLAALLAEGPLPGGALVALARDLARALATLHAAGWSHGDVSPHNVLIDDAGEILLADLGLAAALGSRRPEGAGTPGFAAPEAVLPGEAKAASDVYGWGAVVLAAALGHRPFDESQLAEAAARGANLPPFPEALAALGPLVVAALAREPDSRPTASSLLEALGVMDAQREPLAARVASRRMEPPELIAAPRVVVAATPPPRAVGLTAAASAPSVASPRRWSFVLGALVTLLFGVWLGRVSDRAARPTIGVLGAVPRRMELAIDARPVLGAGDEPVHVEPGRHTITVSVARAEKTYDVDVKRGDRVLLVPIGKPPLDEERGP